MKKTLKLNVISKTFILFILGVMFFGINKVQAITLYVDPISPNPGGEYNSWDTAAHEISTGINAMSGGDELIIRDGNYTGGINMISDLIPSGFVDAFTIVRAENDYGVIIDGEHSNDNVPLNITGNYIKVRGIEFRRAADRGWEQSGQTVTVSGDHDWLYRVGGTDGAGRENHANDSSIFATSHSTYTLFEECYAYGSGHYNFLIYDSDYIVLRRCVSRKDTWQEEVGANYQTYSSDYVEYQNCIVVDEDQPRHWHPGNVDDMWGGFGVNADSSNVFFRGDIVYNISGKEGVNTKDTAGIGHSITYIPGFYVSSTVVSPNIVIDNSAVINTPSGVQSYNDVHITFSTFYNQFLDSPSIEWDGLGLVSIPGHPSAIASNNIVYGSGYSALERTDSSSDYNFLYSNNNNYTGGSVAGINDVSNVDYKWRVSNTTGGLKYPVRVESESNISNSSFGGFDPGAAIIKRYGTDGTFYGEIEYNTLSNIDLWPFPGESYIKTRMGLYNETDSYDNISPGHLINGDRGFASSTDLQLDGITPVTLTSYIWESLGNQIPCEIYNTCGTVIRADVDQSGTINSTDALLTLRNSLGLEMLGTNWQASSTTGDVNCDSSSNSTDALLILRDSLELDMSGTGWCG